MTSKSFNSILFQFYSDFLIVNQNWSNNEYSAYLGKTSPPAKKSVVCSDHFEEHFFDRSGQFACEQETSFSCRNTSSMFCDCNVFKWNNIIRISTSSRAATTLYMEHRLMSRCLSVARSTRFESPRIPRTAAINYDAEGDTGNITEQSSSSIQDTSSTSLQNQYDINCSLARRPHIYRDKWSKNI